MRFSFVHRMSFVWLMPFAVACAADPTPEREPRHVDSLTPELSSAVEGNTAFAWSLFDQLRKEEGNLFFSPFSISAAFGMTYAGAGGETATQMESALAIRDPGTFHGSFGGLVRDLNGDMGRGYELFIANRLFGQDGYAFEPAFTSLVADDYGAGLERVDFKGGTDASRTRINDWVSDATEGNIPALVGTDGVDQGTRLFLANAIYFKADWHEKFDEAETHSSIFRLRNGHSVSVPTMSRWGEYRVHVGEELAALEMDYADQELSMVFVIPQDTITVEEMEARVARDGIDPLLGKLREEKTHVQVPRFEFRDRTDLRATLESMGMTDAFDAFDADFSPMSAPGSEPLYLQRAIHEAYVKVDETGTEAAAATGVSSGAGSARPGEFHIDRPFVFVIRDRLTDSILFVGRVDDPRAAE